jgi:hypothetical protein
MKLERYQYLRSNNYQDYNFYSEGPKGYISKIVTFTIIPNTDPPVYNLALGDVSADTGELNDTVVSNNGDSNIVLATVANIVLEFCNHHGDSYIYARGSTSSRTRLYQMGIAGSWEEISTGFEVYGLKDNVWQDFKPYSVNYDAFLIKRK